MKKQIEKYILDAIDFEGSNLEKLNYVLQCFAVEYECEYERVRQPNVQKRFSDYLQGLPSCISVEYRNCEIINIAKSWGSIPENATENQKYKITYNWFNYISSHFFRMVRNEGAILA